MKYSLRLSLLALATVSSLFASSAWAGFVDFGAASTPLAPALAKKHDLPVNSGFLVTSVTENGAAESLGLQQGDIVTSLNGRPIYSAAKLSQIVAATCAKGDTVELGWLREGEAMTGKATLNDTVGRMALRGGGVQFGGSLSDMMDLAKGNSGVVVLDGPEDFPPQLQGLLSQAGVDLSQLSGAQSTTVINGVSVMMQTPDGSISIGNEDSQGRRKVKIKGKDGKETFNDSITESEIDDKIPSSSREMVRGAFSGKFFKIETRGIGGRKPDVDTADLLEKLEKKSEGE